MYDANEYNQNKRRKTIQWGTTVFGSIHLIGVLFISIGLFVMLNSGVYLLRLVSYCYIPAAFIGGFFLAFPVNRYDPETTRVGVIICCIAIFFGIFLNSCSIYEHEGEGRSADDLFNGDYPITTFFKRGDRNENVHDPIYRYWPGNSQDNGYSETNDVTVVRLAQGVNLNQNNANSGYGKLVLTNWDARFWINILFLLLQLGCFGFLCFFLCNDTLYFGKDAYRMPFSNSVGALITLYSAWIATGLYSGLTLMGLWSYFMGTPHLNPCEFYHLVPAFVVGMFFRPPTDTNFGDPDLAARFRVASVLSVFSTIVLLVLLIHIGLDLDEKGPGLFGDYKSMFNGTQYLLIFTGDTNEARYFDDVFLTPDQASLISSGTCWPDPTSTTCDAYAVDTSGHQRYVRVTSNLIRSYFNNVTYAFDSVGDDFFHNHVAGMLLFDHILTILLFVLSLLMSIGAVMHWHSARQQQKSGQNTNEYEPLLDQNQIPEAKPVNNEISSLIGMRMRTPSVSQRRIHISSV